MYVSCVGSNHTEIFGQKHLAITPSVQELRNERKAVSGYYETGL